jgi:murein DD-endopeptidase MepM/ murein hydrolase activator NlpD
MASGTVSAISLNLRDEPYANANVNAVLAKGSAVDVITTSEDQSWLLVSALVDGQTRIGWAMAQFIDMDGGTSSPPATILGDVAALPPEDPVPFAKLAAPPSQTFWPVVTADPQAMSVSYKTTSGTFIPWNNFRYFFANRVGGTRHHVGVDVYCREGDEVVACADGTIVFFDHFTDSHGQPTNQLLVEHAGVVINYGEVAPNSNTTFGWKRGDNVAAGQRIARVGATRMLHFETYVPGTKQNHKWMIGGPRPSELLNPTQLLLTLAATGKRE